MVYFWDLELDEVVMKLDPISCREEMSGGKDCIPICGDRSERKKDCLIL
jgi:hypothetical protein